MDLYCVVPELNTDANFQNEERIPQLIVRARAGDANAMEELTDCLQGYVSVVAQQHFVTQLRSKVGQSDIVQQSLWKAADNFSEFRGQTEGELKAWVRRIIINETHSLERAYRSDKRDVNREVARGDYEGASAVIRGLADALPTPRTQAIGDEQQAAVMAALERLPLEYQQVIRMRMWQNFPFKLIGETLGKSENAATKIWIRALVRLQDELEQNEMDP